jgi:hypothetical protein
MAAQIRRCAGRGTAEVTRASQEQHLGTGLRKDSGTWTNLGLGRWIGVEDSPSDGTRDENLTLENGSRGTRTLPEDLSRGSPVERNRIEDRTAGAGV